MTTLTYNEFAETQSLAVTFGEGASPPALFEASYDGDATKAWRDTRGRVLELSESWLDAGGSAQAREVDYEYDGLGRLTRVLLPATYLDGVANGLFDGHRAAA